MGEGVRFPEFSAAQDGGSLQELGRRHQLETAYFQGKQLRGVIFFNAFKAKERSGFPWFGMQMPVSVVRVLRSAKLVFPVWAKSVGEK